MARTLVIDNDPGWISKVERDVRRIFQTDAQVSLTSVEELAFFLRDDPNLEDIAFAIVDLELAQPHEGQDDPVDQTGRDDVLPLLRQAIPWVPAILCSAYIKGQPAQLASILADVTPFGFDAVFPKRFLNADVVYRAPSALRHNISLARTATLLGISVHQARERLRSQIDIRFSLPVDEALAEVGRPLFDDLCKLAGFNQGELILDQIISGFSGVRVLKATHQCGDRRVSWLLKFGRKIAKLVKEMRAHRMMFEDGSTRHMSVPPYWWFPMVWNGHALIACEFRERAETLREYCGGNDVAKAVNATRRLFSEFYATKTKRRVIPRDFLSPLVEKSKGWSLNRHPISVEVGNLCARQRSAMLDDSALLTVGSSHGDLHLRNVMINSSGAVLIDFAHYSNDPTTASPVLDFAKLVVDMAAMDVVDTTVEDILEGQILNDGTITKLAASFLCRSRGKISQADCGVFRVAAAVQLLKYLDYEDINENFKNEVRSVMMK